MYNSCRNLDLIVFDKPINILVIRITYTYCHVSTIACAYIVTLCFHVVLCIATNRFLREIVFYHRYNNMFYRPQIFNYNATRSVRYRNTSLAQGLCKSCSDSAVCIINIVGLYIQRQRLPASLYFFFYFLFCFS